MPCAQISLLDLRDGGRAGKIDGLGDGIVCVSLEGGLHLDMTYVVDVVSTSKYLAYITWHLVVVSNCALMRYAGHQGSTIKTACICGSLKEWIDLDELGTTHYASHIGDGKEWLDTRTGASDDRNSACRSNGSDSGVAHLDALLIPGAIPPIGKYSSLLG